MCTSIPCGRDGLLISSTLFAILLNCNVKSSEQWYMIQKEYPYVNVRTTNTVTYDKYNDMAVTSTVYIIISNRIKANKNIVVSLPFFTFSRYALIKTGPGFDSTSPFIITCFRFKNVVSYDTSFFTQKDVRGVLRRMPDLVSK